MNDLARGGGSMRRIELSGTHAAMGEAFGEAFRSEIAQLYALRLENALRQATQYGGRPTGEADLLRLARACLAASERFDPRGTAELRGVARGARLTPEQTLAMNGLTDLRDALAWGDRDALGATGCTALIAQRDTTRDGLPRLAQSWDLASDNAPFVVFVERRPSEGARTWSITTVGCQSLMSMNEHRLALGTTNLRTRDAGVGVPYLGLIHRALEERSAAQAARVIAAAPRAGAHSYLALDARGGGFVVECTGKLSHTFVVERGTHVHTNHCQVPAHIALEADTPRRSSEARLARMRALLAAQSGQIDSAFLRDCYADPAGGSLAICRRDFDGISTNAASVMTPELGELWGCAGVPDSSDKWERLL
ncbi:MAG TPA: C45 family peptidase [Myxococcota bacterium]|nr:C45 family peptidase [Myxococcota bacterium]